MIRTFCCNVQVWLTQLVLNILFLLTDEVTHVYFQQLYNICKYKITSNCIFFVFSRHLDNLLLTDDGRLFHVDFAFILGRDPKPFPPPMKLCKEMVEAMGGAER